MKTTKQLTITKAELQRELSQLAGSIFVISLLFLIYSIIKIIKVGYSIEVLIILLGSIFSTIGAFLYEITIILYGVEHRKSCLAMFFTFLGFIPYLFGCYLVFYIGIYEIIKLFTSFSLWNLILSSASIILGYFMVRKIWLISEIGRAVSEERIKINSD